MRLFAYSKALYATWFYVDTLRLLLDAGEGVNTWLEGRLLAIRDLALTHGHTDHFTGLHNVLVTRLRFHEETEPLEPLRVFWPAGEPEIERYLAYLDQALLQRHPDLAELVPLRAGERVALRAVRGLFLEPFPVRHRGGSTCFGYRVLQERHQLRPELEGRPQAEINRLAAEGGRDAVAIRVELPILVFSGDSQPLAPEVARDAELLVHEATFIDERLDRSHSTLADAVRVWREAGAHRLVLYHFSSRYHEQEIKRALRRLVPDDEERGRVRFVAPGRLFDQNVPIAGL